MGTVRLTVGMVGIFFFPAFTHAAVVINEIAWMGGVDSANDEWIELYNNGDTAVVLDGWTLTDGVSLDIELSGTIAAQSYAVLERTDDDSAAGNAFLIYTGALANDGRILTLYNENGSIQDQVAGGENWESVGGNNETKETAQLTTEGWTTAGATPGAHNATVFEQAQVKEAPHDDEEEETEPQAPARSTSGSGGGGSSRTVKQSSPSELALFVEQERTAYVDQEITFSVAAEGPGQAIIDSLRYMWNFGDGHTKRGREPTHRYAFAGTYIVIVDAAYATHKAQERMEVTVLPVMLSLEKTQDGNVMVHNNARYETDIGSMVLSNGEATFTIPQNTIVVPGGTITLHKKQTRFKDTASLALITTDGNLTARYPAEESDYAVVEDTERTVAASVSQVAVAEDRDAVFTETTGSGGIENPPNTASYKSTDNTIVLGEETTRTTPVSNSMLPLLGLIGVISIGILALYSGRLV